MTFDLPASTPFTTASLLASRDHGEREKQIHSHASLHCQWREASALHCLQEKEPPKRHDFSQASHCLCGWTACWSVTGLQQCGPEDRGETSKKSMLVLDAFQCHKSPVLKKKLCDVKTTLAIIPGGMTSILQPLDVSINKPIKVLPQQRWNQWYSDGKHSYTATGRMRKTELNVIV